MKGAHRTCTHRRLPPAHTTSVGFDIRNSSSQRRQNVVFSDILCPGLSNNGHAGNGTVSPVNPMRGSRSYSNGARDAAMLTTLSGVGGQLRFAIGLPSRVISRTTGGLFSKGSVMTRNVTFTPRFCMAEGLMFPMSARSRTFAVPFFSAYPTVIASFLFYTGTLPQDRLFSPVEVTP